MTTSVSSTRRHPAMFVGAMVMLVCVTFTFFLGAPLFVALMNQQWHFTQSHIGFIVTADTIGNAAGALAVALGIRGWPIRRIMVAGMLAIMGGNVLIALGLGIQAAIVGGLVSGVGNGIVSGTAIGFLTYSKSPQRSIAIMVVCENVYAMLLMSVILPGLGGRWEATGAFYFIALACCVCVPAMLFFSRKETFPTAFREGRVQKLGVYLTLLALYLFYVSVGTTWTFLATAVESQGILRPFIEHMLSVSNFFSLAVCFLVPAMARHNLYGWSLLSLTVFAVSAIFLAFPLTSTGFAVETMIFVSTWTLAGILLPTHVAGFDPVGRHAAVIPAVLGLGYSTGSFLGGMIGESVSNTRAFQFSAACACVAVVVLIARRVLAGNGDFSAPTEPTQVAVPNLVV